MKSIVILTTVLAVTIASMLLLFRYLIKKGNSSKTFFWATSLGAITILAGAGYIMTGKTVIDPFVGTEWDLGAVVLIILFLYILASLRIIGPRELGAILLFGRPVINVGSGLVFVPLGFCSLSIETKLVIQMELPADPENIFRAKEGDSTIPEGKFPPIRITFGEIDEVKIKAVPGQDSVETFEISPKTDEQIRQERNNNNKQRKGETEEEEDPLASERLTEEVVPVIRFLIIDYAQFLGSIGSREEAKRQVQDTVVGTLTLEFAKVTIGTALRNLSVYNKRLTDEIRGITRGWGIEFRSATIKSVNLSRGLNQNIQSVVEARFKRRADAIQGAGEGAKNEAQLAGRGRGLKQMAKDLAISTSEVLGAETAREISNGPGTTIIVGPEGMQNLAAIGAAFGAGAAGAKKTSP